MSRSSSICWIEHPLGYRLGITARPRSGDWLADEIDAWKADGVATIVSLLEAEEVADLALEAEAELCRTGGIDFRSFPIPDRGVPDRRETGELAKALVEILRDGQAVAIHCRAGIGRASLLAAAVLILTGNGPEAALDAIERARGLGVPDTEAQRAWVLEFGSSSPEMD